MVSLQLPINNQPNTVEVEPMVTQLWVIRDVIGLAGVTIPFDNDVVEF